MKILFCKISSMKYYKGHCENDVPVNGGKYVYEHGYGHEEYNFTPIVIADEKDEKCFGFVEPKSNNGARNTFHIENIQGCEAMKNKPCVEDVLVVWCATRVEGDTTIVGWYKHATVYRNLQKRTFILDNADDEDRCYNVLARAIDCTLLSESERNRHIWFVPLARYTKSFGFGQSMVWYPNELEAEEYVSNLLKSINDYKGENWLTKYPE